MIWEIDQKHSSVSFSIKHMGFTNVRGQFHQYRATIRLNLGDLTQSQFSGEIDVASVDTHEPQRDEHLRSAEFFDVAHFPTMTYESTRIEALGGNRFRVFGRLTLHGITQEVAIEGDYAGEPQPDPWGALRTGFSGSGTLNRKDFGLVWNVGLDRGGLLVGDTVHVQLNIELVGKEA